MKLSELKRFVMKPKTYTDAIETGTRRKTTTNQETPLNRRNPLPPPPTVNHIEETRQCNIQHKVQQHHEKNKLEVILSKTEMNPDTKKQMKQHCHAEITAKLQQNVKSQAKNNFPIIHRIEKLKSQNIRIHCNTEEEAEQLCKLNWDKVYNDLTMQQSKYGIMIFGVSIEMINSNELKNPEIARQLEQQNKEKGIQIIAMKTLQRKLKNNTKHYSLIVFLTSPESADQCIKHGLYINHQ